jgi:hypothetical protein
MVNISIQTENRAPPDPLLLIAARIPSSYNEALETIKSEATQRVRVDSDKTKGRCSVVFLVHDDPLPSGPGFPMSMSADSTGPDKEWAEKLGWDSELQRIASILHAPTKDAKDRLRMLVELPSHDKILQANCDIQKSVEIGLLRLNKLSITYFSDAVGWISQKHSSFRLLFGKDGFVFYQRFSARSHHFL